MELIMNANNTVTAVFELLDADGDGVADANDTCTNTSEGATVDENGCLVNAIYFDDNGVTIKATESFIIGNSYFLNDISYLVVDSTILYEMVANNEDVNKVVTTNLKNMKELFKDASKPDHISIKISSG